MKSDPFAIGGFAGLILGIAVICFSVLALFASIHGLVLAFQASILLGFFVLLVEPMPLVIGLAYWFWDVNLAQKIMEWVQN